MHFLIVGSVLYVLSISGRVPSVVTQPLTKKELEKNVQQMILACKQETGASLADLEALGNRKMPESREGICMVECIFDKTHIMENGKFSKDGMIKGFASLSDDNEARLKIVEELATICEEKIGKGVEDKCQNAKLVADCFTEYESNHNIQIPSSLSR